MYWKNLCNSFHLCKEVIKKEKELLGLYSEVAVKWLKLNYSLRKRISCLNVVIHEKELEGEASFDFIAVDPICNGYCIKVSKGTSPSLSLLKKKGTIFCNCALIKDVFPSGLFEVIWCRSTPTNVLLHGNNAVWIEFSFSCRDPQSPPVITEWENDTIISNTYNVFTRCADCLLVVVMEKNKYSDDQKLWSIEFLELRKNPVRVYHYKGFISEFELKDNIPSKVYKTHIYCKGTCGGVFCKEHYILIQFGFSIVLFRITRSEGSCTQIYNISDPIQILYPLTSSATLLDGPFSLSHDKTLLCLLTKDYSKTRGQLCVSIRSHIWNLESDSYSILEVMDVSCGSVRNTLGCIAVGHLYHLIFVNSQVVIVETGSGRIVTEVNLLSHSPSPHLSVTSKEWMNSLPVDCNFTELFSVFSYEKDYTTILCTDYVMNFE